MISLVALFVKVSNALYQMVTQLHTLKIFQSEISTHLKKAVLGHLDSCGSRKPKVVEILDNVDWCHHL